MGTEMALEGADGGGVYAVVRYGCGTALRGGSYGSWGGRSWIRPEVWARLAIRDI